MALSVAVHPTNTDTICVGLRGSGLFCSEDGGATWAPSAAGLNPGASVSDVLFDPTKPDVMYAADLHSGVFRSNDGGGLWVRITDGLRTRAVNALAISTDGSTLYAATEGEGVFRLALWPADGGG